MPELPEVETVARGLAKRLERHRLVKVETRRAAICAGPSPRASPRS